MSIAQEEKADILTLAEKGDAGSVWRDMRVRSLYSPYYFGRMVLQYRQMVDHLHQHDLEFFVTRWSNGVRKQGVEWPRGFFKTSSFTINTGIWGVLPVTDEDSHYAIDKLGIEESKWFQRVSLHDQNATNLYAFETYDNACKKVGEAQWHFEENQIFRWCFPEIAYTASSEEKPWSDSHIRIRRTGVAQRLNEGTFEAIGANGALQSRHYRRVWEDDLVGKKAVESETVMSKTIRWHGLLHGAFENAAEQERFIIANRWGLNDLNGYVRQNEGLDWAWYTRRAIEIDDTGREYSIFPERYSLADLYKIRDSGSMTLRDFHCQYLNDPLPAGSGESGINKIHYYEVETDEHGAMCICSCGARWRASQMRRFMHYDPYRARGIASKSRPAVVVVGTCPDMHVFLLDYFVLRENYSTIFNRIFDFNDQWLPELFTYEDVGGQDMAEFHIEAISPTAEFQNKHRRFPRIEGVPTKQQQKDDRIRHLFLPRVELGKFAIRREHQMFISQMTSFPEPVLDHDYDLLDALAQGAPLWQYPLKLDDGIIVKPKEEDVELIVGQSYSRGGSKWYAR